MDERLFFDIHCHAMNLSHPNLLALIKRSPWKLLNMALANLSTIFALLSKNRPLNLLAIMENDIGDIFLMVEYFLKKQGIIQPNGTLTIDGLTFDTMVLTPLLMDFSYKNLRSDIYYNIPPEKPIDEQILDVFNGISKYCACELIEKTPGNYQIQKRQNKAIFEIYPFLGITTNHYTTEEISIVLEKYFGEYSGSYAALKANFGRFEGNLKLLGSNYFAGIKVYPPMGFDPWPELDLEELTKIKRLYQYCCDKQIPLTSHCSQIGFNLDDQADTYTAPQKWQKVLRDFPDLKLNLAHFGEQTKFLYMFENHEWEDEIVRLIKDNKNVYTDFSYRGCHKNYYRSMKKTIGSDEKLLNHVLFGSDFMINLLLIDSYNEYLSIFKRTDGLTPDEKALFCATNPRRFLFKEDSP